MPGAFSQCSSCGKNFRVRAEQVLFCSKTCEKQHDLFKVWKKTIKKSQTGGLARNEFDTLIIT